MAEKNNSKIKLIAIVATIVLAIVGILMATEDTQINFEDTYNIPAFNSLAELPTTGYGQWAVAVDNNIVTTSEPSAPLPATPTASTAKMILALAVMQAKPFNFGEKGEAITISSEYFNRYLWYVANGGSVSAVALGAEISEYDALASVMLPSSNNMADTLAIWAFGSLDAYRDYATDMLSKWGLANTKIGNDASGFSETTTSTAADLALIGQKVLENPVLAEIVELKNHSVPVAGELRNSNQLLGELGIVGVKTGWIGDASGYQLVSGYRIPDELSADDHIVTLALLGAPTRASSFSDSRRLVSALQELLVDKVLVKQNDTVGYIDSWWTGRVPVSAKTTLKALGWEGMEKSVDFETNLSEQTVGGEQPLGKMRVRLATRSYETELITDQIQTAPSLWQRFLHLFGWKASTPVQPVEKPVENSENIPEQAPEVAAEGQIKETDEKIAEKSEQEEKTQSSQQNAIAEGGNCTTSFGPLMLINPNFTVSTSFIATRKTQLISVSKTYGIPEYNSNNGDNLLDAEAATHLNEMLKAYAEAYPGHSMGTRSCFRQKGTNCGRLCAATGTSDHHTGYTCDLIDNAYGTTLDTDYYSSHIEWQWLKQNSYKYGFIDRFPAAWAGGSMTEPLNVDANGSTGLFETWHYRYVGITAATEIATGKYNNGAYDSLEHYLLATGRVKSLKPASCE
ncbi:D-alanyl-D-alanine carboxypeptidase family protein [Candidatus Saccharibacteria bacterium]|nr:D-alanyl-D-alanine carboxypeptidase family protein [Candidatus Saccharibacteria bacterium]